MEVSHKSMEIEQNVMLSPVLDLIQDCFSISLCHAKLVSASLFVMLSPVLDLIQDCFSIQ